MCAPCAFDSGFLGSVKVMGPEDLPGGGNASHSTPHNVTVMGIKLKNSVTGEKKKKQLAVLGQGQAWVSGDSAQQLFCIWVGGGARG